MDIKLTEEKMNKCVKSLEHNLQKVRTGRANPNMLDGIEVDYYGCPTPINQIASVSVQEGRTLCIKPYDSSIFLLLYIIQMLLKKLLISQNLVFHL